VVAQIEGLTTSFKIMDKLKIAIVIIVLIIVAAFFLTRFPTEQSTKVEELKLGQIERISGMVTSVYVSKEKHVFLKVADNTGEIDIVVFKSSNIDEAYELELGDEVSVLGRIDEYKGKKEIIAQEIRKI